MKLLVLSDVSQVEYLLKNQEDVLMTHRPMTQDLAVAHELDRLQIPFIDEYCYLSPKEIEENWNQAHELAEIWQYYTLGDGISLELWDLAKQDLVYPFEICLNARTAYRHILESDTVESLCGFWFLPQPIVRTGPAPATHAAASLAQAVLCYLVELKQIPIHCLQCSFPLSVEGLGWRPRRPPVVIPGNNRHATSHGKVVMMLSTFMGAHEWALLEQHFDAHADYQLVRILPWELGTAGLFATAIHQTKFDAALQNARRGLAKSRLEYRGPYPEIFANPHLEFQFLRSFDEIQVAACIGAAFGAVLDVLQPSLLILGHDAFTQERMLVWQAQMRGIPTVSMFHGGLAHSAGWRGIVGTTDHVLAWSESDKRLLEYYGVDSARIYAVGSLQYAQKYSEVDKVHTIGQASNRRALAKRRLGLPTDQPVVAFLTAATSTGFAGIIVDLPSHRKTWAKLVSMAENCSNITFVIKPHPSYDHYEFYRQLTIRGPKNMVLLESAILDDVLVVTDIAVLVNYCTTAALEAQLAGIPVVFLRNAILPLHSREDSLKEHGAVPVTKLKELESTLDNLLQNDIARTAILDDAKWVLRQYLGEKDNPVMPRIEAVLDQISQASLPAVDDRLRVGIGERYSFELAEAARMLWMGAEASAYLLALRNLRVSAKDDSQSDICNETNLFSLAYSLGLYAENASTLFRLASESLTAMRSVHPVTALERQQFLLIAFLAAMIRAIDSGQWRVSHSYAWVCLRRMPGATARSPLFWRCLTKSLVVSNRFLLTLANLVGRVYSNWVRLQKTRYQEIG